VLLTRLYVSWCSSSTAPAGCTSAASPNIPPGVDPAACPQPRPHPRRAFPRTRLKQAAGAVQVFCCITVKSASISRSSHLA
jgi:hypothetical protein